MLLDESRVLDGLMHSSQLVRQAVGDYFAKSYRTQVDVTHKVIQAVETFGWADVFEWPHIACNFDLDETLLPWALDQLERTDAGAITKDRRPHLVRMIARAPVEAILPHVDRIFSHELFKIGQNASINDDPPGTQIQKRITLHEHTVDECWENLLRHCEDVGSVESFADANIPFAERLVERIVAGGDFARHDEVCRILAQPEVDLDGADAWRIGLMIILAGQLKIEAATPLIFEHFKHDWGWYNEEIGCALIRIGTASVHRHVADCYSETEWYVRNFSLSVFEHIHTETVVHEALSLLEYETQNDLRVRLATAAASHFDSRAVDVAREIYLEDTNDPERCEIAELLIAYSHLSGFDLPERDEWASTIEANNAERERRLRAMNTRLKRLQEVRPHNSVQPVEPIVEDSLSTYATATITNETAKVGRNDPCPCGSGKKYKKCCLRKSQLDA